MKAVESIKKITKVFILTIFLGHEDGGCIQDETRRQQFGKSQILRRMICSKSYRQLNFFTQEKTECHP